MPEAITAAVQSQIITAPTPKAVRPTAASIAALPVMTVPENCRSPGPNATQLAIAPKQQKIATAIKYCRMRSQRGASGGKSPDALTAPRDGMMSAAPARKNTAPAQSNTHNGLCRFDGPPGIGNRRAPTAMKYKPTAAATAA